MLENQETTDLGLKNPRTLIPYHSRQSKAGRTEANTEPHTRSLSDQFEKIKKRVKLRFAFPPPRSPVMVYKFSEGGGSKFKIFAFDFFNSGKIMIKS
jgi:hypothetical protein